MLKWEEKLIDWFNRYMILIATVFVVAAAAWMRMAGRNYVGNDYHCSLYDVPGNCNAWLLRRLTDFLMLHFADTTIAILKILAYGGDFAVALLALMLSRKEGTLKQFLLLSAFLLSPVSLLYSVSGMKIDSVCMSGLLLACLCLRRGLPVPALLLAAACGFLYPAYWPVSIGFGIFVIVKALKKECFAVHKVTWQTVAAGFLLILCLLFSVFLENQDIGYFWGKIFVINPLTGESYSGLLPWLAGMCRTYGYLFAMSLTLLAVRCRKLRIPALIVQAAVTMYVGWQQTFFMAL